MGRNKNLNLISLAVGLGVFSYVLFRILHLWTKSTVVWIGLSNQILTPYDLPE